VTRKRVSQGARTATAGSYVALLVIIGCTLAAFSILPPCLAGPTADRSAQSKIDQARDLLNRGDFAGARKILEQLPETDQTAESRFLLGKLFYLWDDSKRAVELLEKAAAENPNDSDYFLWLGRSLGRKAQQASFFKAPFIAGKVRDAFQKAVQLNPENLDARDDLLQYYLEAPPFLGGGTDKARKLVEEIEVSHPARYHAQLAQTFLKQKEYDKAEKELCRSIEIRPHEFWNYAALAEFYENRNQTDQARKVLLKATALFPKTPEAHFILGRFEAQGAEDLERAIQELQLFLDTYSGGDPYPFEARYWLGHVYLKLDQPQKAGEEFKEALRAFPAHGPSLKGEVEAARRIGKAGRGSVARPEARMP
jgi:tetratricopeptide (TPR) repeat protein